jgi:hypothetical protein
MKKYKEPEIKVHGSLQEITRNGPSKPAGGNDQMTGSGPLPD